MGFLFVKCLTEARYDSEAFTQFYAIFIALTGLLAPNPISWFSADRPNKSVLDSVLVSLFLAVFRVFLVFQLDMLLANSDRPGKTLIRTLCVFFALYAAVDAFASHTRRMLVSSSPDFHSILRVEMARALFHIVYALIAIGYIAIAIRRSADLNFRRLLYYGMVTSLVVLLNFVTDGVFLLWGPWLNTCKPEMIRLSVALGFAGMTLFLLRPASGPVYLGLEDDKQIEQGVVEIDEISGDDAVSNEEDASEP
jgi:hypothetical protein